MNASERFATLVRGPEPAIPLDESVLLIAAHALPDLDVAFWMNELDALARSCGASTFSGVVDHLVRVEGFLGNDDDYYDPHNSLLPHVIEHRAGIPITLAIVMIEVGRRLGVPIVGVGMPGHFLVRDANREVFADPFTGSLLDRDACEHLFHAIHADLPFDPAYLAPTGTRAVLARVLSNLKGIYTARGERRSLTWVLRLRAEIPGVPLSERRDLASTLAADGQFGHAAAELDRLADLAKDAGDELLATDATHGATRLRARLN